MCIEARSSHCTTISSGDFVKMLNPTLHTVQERVWSIVYVSIINYNMLERLNEAVKQALKKESNTHFDSYSVLLPFLV